MTIHEAITRFNRLVQQEYDAGELTFWLSELDGMAKNEIFDRYCCNPAQDWQPYTNQTPPDTRLLIPAPYDGIYFDYLRMKTDSWNKEQSYNNSAASYNNMYASFADFWRRTHTASQPELRV